MTVDTIFAIGASGVAVVGGLVAIVRWIVGLAGKVKDLDHNHASHETAINDLRHDGKNQRARVDALEHLRTADVERIVRLETSFSNVEKSLDRIERAQADSFDALSTSIREIRIVAPKG